MSMEITEVHYDPDPKHIIIRESNLIIDCNNPIEADEWLNGTLGETLCLSDNQYMDFQKNLCDTVYLTDELIITKIARENCSSCGVLNGLGCCLNSITLNTTGVDTLDCQT